MLAVTGWPLLTGLTVALAPTEAFAKSRSSGGYSRPSGSSARTPSFSSSRPSVRTPSTSGGYARPAPSAPSRPSFAPPSSAGDRAVSRQQSAGALGAFRTQQDTASRPPAAAPSPSSVWGSPTRNAPPPPVIRQTERPGWYSQRGWTNPGSWLGQPRRFGIWDGLFLGALLSNLSRPASADFFHNRQNDPGYQEWRAEADKMARDNADLRQKLAELDKQLAARKGTPIDPNYVPTDVPAEVALAPTVAERTPSVAANDNEDSTPWVWIALLVGGAVVGWAVWQKMRQRGGTGDAPMKMFGTAGAMLQHKLSGEGYTPDRFRVGMTFPFDPTPFVLASGATKVVAPAPDTGAMRLNVTAVGTAVGGGAALTRLYLPDNRSVFQLHMDPAGTPDECRFFSRIDEINPADQQEWEVWLHPSEGMIGWPQFQTKDGKLYDRVWAPSPARIPPLDMTETIETAEGGAPKTLRRQAMLYAAPTGAPPPAPETEYILVSVVEADGQAWVEVAAGMDVSPGMLELS